MRRPMLATTCVMLLTAVALAGCGGSSAPKALTIAFKSPAVAHSTLPARYTCDGSNISPPLEWGGVPSTARELAVFMLALTPNRATGRYRTSVVWAMAGVNPGLHRLAAGEVPPGAHVSVTEKGKSQRYSVCPARGHATTYQFALYAVPAGLQVPSQFVGVKLLELIANPESSASANAGGSFAASYARPGHAVRHT